ncbi:hypothetical protein BDR05DRAFT_969763 [Suillus weaverae]|nr:hypothetical protein BDR05DRAFT_969763 [Suillus weaverae]
MTISALTSQSYYPANLHPCVSPLAHCDSAMVVSIFSLHISIAIESNWTHPAPLGLQFSMSYSSFNVPLKLSRGHLRLDASNFWVH